VKLFPPPDYYFFSVFFLFPSPAVFSMPFLAYDLSLASFLAAAPTRALFPFFSLSPNLPDFLTPPSGGFVYVCLLCFPVSVFFFSLFFQAPIDAILNRQCFDARLPTGILFFSLVSFYLLPSSFLVYDPTDPFFMQVVRVVFAKNFILFSPPPSPLPNFRALPHVVFFLAVSPLVVLPLPY